MQNSSRAGTIDRFFIEGDQFIVPHTTLGDLTWDIIGIGQDTPANANYKTYFPSGKPLTLQLHTPLAARVFDAPEANYKIQVQINADSKNVITLHSNALASATYRFTATKNLVVNGLIRIIDATHFGYYATSTSSVETMDMEAGAEGDGFVALTVSPTVGATLSAQNNKDKVTYGSNRWAHSATRQWLNSAAAAGSWWASKNDYDLPTATAASQAGFLSGIDPDFLAVLGNVTKRTAKNIVTDGATDNTVVGDIGANDYEDLSEKFFFLSRNEVNGVKENLIPEGEPYTYYLQSGAETADAVAWRIKYSAVPAAIAWWLRSSGSPTAHIARLVSTTGQVSSYVANNSSSVAPACVII